MQIDKELIKLNSIATYILDKYDNENITSFLTEKVRFFSIKIMKSNSKKVSTRRLKKILKKKLIVIVYNGDKKKRKKKRISKKNFLAEMNSYYNTKGWYNKRMLIIERENGKCEDCGKDGNVIHHKTYDNFKNEKLEDLMCLCRYCHDKIHNFKHNK